MGEQDDYQRAGWQAAEHRRRLQLVPEPVRETAYAIKLTTSGHWLGDRRVWVESSQDALRFPNMTRATIVAIEWLQLAPDAFTIEAVS